MGLDSDFSQCADAHKLCRQLLLAVYYLIPFSLSNSEGSERISLEAGAVNDDKERRVDRFDLRARPSTAKLDI